MLKIKCIFLIILYSLGLNNAQENICIINGKKSLNTVSDEFLSISIDPALILSPQSTITNTSAIKSLKLARYMAPGFVRISGPSTEFLQFSETDNFSPNSLTITPSIWKSFNVWIKKSKLTPIIAINDKLLGQTNDSWDPKILSPLLKINEDHDFSCYWQLGYDCKSKTLSQYKEDLLTLRGFLDSYPTRQFYKIAGSNLHSCLAHRTPELAGKFIEDLEYTADAINWETDYAKSMPFLTKIYMPIWLGLPKDSNSVSFTSSLQWAKQIGDAAKSGYKVIFRQPRIHELYADTPVYWVSLIHKALMGKTVLDVTTNNQHQENSYVYAHCAKNQVKNQGAITLLVINNGGNQYTSFLRLASSPQPKVVEIESYILTSEKDDSRNIYLNEKKLTMDDLRDYPYKPVPKIRRVKVDKLLSLSVPAKSIGFFVLLAAKIKVCIDVTNQNTLLSKEMPWHLTEHTNKPENLQNLFESLHKEIKEDEKFYGKNDQTTKSFLERPRIYKLKNNRILKESKLMRNYLNKLKLPITKPKLEIIFTERPMNIDKDKKKVELQLSKSEIRKILTERAKSVIAKNHIHVTSSEAHNLMTEATKTLIKRLNRNKLLRLKPPMNWVKNFRNKTKAAIVNRNKRNINMDLLQNTDLRYPPIRTKKIPHKKYSYKIEDDDFDYLQKLPYEQDLDSREFDFNYHKKIEKPEENVYDYGDERIRFLSEAGAARIPRSTNNKLNNREMLRNNSLIQRIRSKNSRLNNKAKSKVAQEKIITQLKERQKNHIEKLKRHHLENRQKIKRTKNNEAVQRQKRMAANEYIPTVPELNAIQRYSKAENVKSKPWKPQDILNIRKAAPYSIEHIDSIEFLQIPFSKNSTNFNKLQKRSIREEILEENAIEYPFNNIYKNKEFNNESIEKFNNYSTATAITLPTDGVNTKETETNPPKFLPNDFIDIISDTKTNDKSGNRQQTKITINEESISNMIMSVTSRILESLATTFSSIFSSEF